jgi:hypothetical protein
LAFWSGTNQGWDWKIGPAGLIADSKGHYDAQDWDGQMNRRRRPGRRDGRTHRPRDPDRKGEFVWNDCAHQSSVGRFRECEFGS